jgi:hypothetical protein
MSRRASRSSPGGWTATGSPASRRNRRLTTGYARRRAYASCRSPILHRMDWDAFATRYAIVWIAVAVVVTILGWLAMGDFQPIVGVVGATIAVGIAAFSDYLLNRG